MKPRDRVILKDTIGTNHGTITVRSDNGMCAVKWDTGITEHIHENELTPENGAPEAKLTLWERVQGLFR